MYEGSATPTTQDDLQAYMKNEHETLECLVDGLWQPETEYQEGHVVRSPNMPAGFIAVAKNAGYTSTNEPDWLAGNADIIDGSIIWDVKKGIVTVNGKSPDITGNITIPEYKLPIATAEEINEGTNSEKVITPLGLEASLKNIGYWKKEEIVTVGTVRFLKGEKYAGYYLKCVTAGTTGKVQPISMFGDTVTIIDGTAKWELCFTASIKEVNDAIAGSLTGISVTGSTQASFTTSSSPDTNSGSGGTNVENQTTTGVPGGNYSLQQILQQLVAKSHSHRQINNSYNCYYDNCSCSSCIISGNILTESGYISIQKLNVGDNILGIDGEYHKVLGIKKSQLGNRKAVKVAGFNSSIFTDDHLFLLQDGYGSYDVSGYYREARQKLSDGNVFGTYDKLERKLVKNLSVGKYCFVLKGGKFCFSNMINYDDISSRVTYTPIVENCEWCFIDNLVVACARYIK